MLSLPLCLDLAFSGGRHLFTRVGMLYPEVDGMCCARQLQECVLE
jgi:hypothetical protein